MAEFKTHLASGLSTGAGMAIVSALYFHLNSLQVFSVAVMGSLGGILPDLDSDTGKPVNFLFGTISVLVPALLLDKVSVYFTPSIEFLVFYFVVSYVFINNVFCELLKKITVHRGIMHSIPFSVLCGELGYLLYLSSGPDMALAVGLAIFIGCINHLMLDELNAVKFKAGVVPVFKRSFGTAMKIYSKSIFATLIVYCILCGATAAIFV